MKKHLFLIASVFAAFTVNAQSTLTVLGDTNVKVQSGALLYVQGDAKVKNYSDTSKKVSNDGKIKITNGLTNENATDGKNFVNEFPKSGEYGQLIVLNQGTNTGFISSGVKFGDSFVYYPFAIPYSSINAGQVVVQIWGKDGSSAFIDFKAGRNPKFPKFDDQRYKNPLFFWNNDEHTLDHLAAGDAIGNSGTEARYYVLSDYSTVLDKIKKDKLHLSGQPLNKSFSLELNSKNKIKGSRDVNKWGETYGSYISDFTKDMPAKWNDYTLGGANVPANGFGDNIYYLGNPYTSNIDLQKLLTQSSAASHVVALIQFNSSTTNGKNEYHPSGNLDGQASNAYGAEMKMVTGQGVGDERLMNVSPFQTFALKTDGTPITLQFNDDIKTFVPAAEGNVNTMFSKNTGTSYFITQVGVELYTKDGKATGSRTYVAASDIYAKENGVITELHNIALKDDKIGIYTEQDSEELATRGGGKLYANGINADTYVGKPVNLVLQNGKGSYVLKSIIGDDLRNSANKFFFEDKKTGKVIKIGEDFAYGFTANGTEKDRFAIYWAAAPKANSVADNAKEATNTTKVFKAGNDYKVRFDKAFKTADVYVYNISGQLVSSAKGINASTDYIVPVQGNATVYIVKVVGDNGSVVTKKIIK
ncbi:T9SS C-terminal target domain-containing protein [Ornithobacterium rhinotracheale]|uniref:T9SS type A sorting domain-containing protein n=1 Tax=Ornithobacterium rhinotracheale TaxID=28251 RepID=UPI00129C287C|nr:T9SS type A sorting domain-containing protein [Ornithobacterium rhinotracheale]MRJ10302.1 T9SS C-terminal target domain-containing protein [Ornithobacterium rhinotracheale]